MSYNEPNDIKRILLLEDENQTIEDDELQEYLDDAQEELYAEIQRNRETESFRFKTTDLDDNDLVEFVLYFRVQEITEVRDKTNNEVIDSDNYELVKNNQAIKIDTDTADLDEGIDIEIDYIPYNYKLCEKAIAVVNILSRLAPFQNEQINPNLMVWREKKKNYINLILGRFGTGSYY
jgi:hypothetical protein